MRRALHWIRRRLHPGDASLELQPVSRGFGTDRGTPIDRWYIEKFLSMYRADIRGTVMEVGDRDYTTRFGQAVTTSIVLSARPGPGVDVVADLAIGHGVPKAQCDAIVLTQVLPFIFDVSSAIAHCYAALRPGGVLLATVPGISQVSRYDAARWGDYWRFTPQGAAALFRDTFGEEHVTHHAYGNLAVSIAFLRGLALEDLRNDMLEPIDSDYPVLIGVRARRPFAEEAAAR